MEPNYVLIGAFSSLALVSAFLVYRLFSVFTDFELKVHGLEERLKMTEKVLEGLRVKAKKIKEASTPKAEYKQVEKKLNEVIAMLLAKQKVEQKHA